MVFNLYFDHKYCYWVGLTIRSIRIFEPNAKIYLHTYNLADWQKEKIKNLKVNACDFMKMEYDPDIADTYYNKPQKEQSFFQDAYRKDLLESTNSSAHEMDTSTLHLRFQISCRKGEFMLKSIEKFPKEDLHIIMDVDMILIRSLNKLRKQMRNYDVGIIRANEAKIMGTFLVARSTAEGKSYFAKFNKQAMNGRLYLCKDQETLSKVYMETKRKIKFLHLNRQYLDPTLQKEAYIWSAHKTKYGTKRQRYERFDDYIKKINGPKTTQ